MSKTDTDANGSERVPAVSVILPTYNRRHCLPRAVESVLRQTFDDLELIVVDDCSKDDTLAWLDSLDDPRLRVLRHEVNKGGAAARNTGIAAARAPVIAFQDSDDEWLVTMLDRQLARMAERGEDHGASYCGKIVYGRDDRFNFGARRAGYMPAANRKVVEGDILDEVLRHAIVSTQTLVVRKDVLDAVGGFDETLRVGLDWELTVRIARHTKFAFVEEPLVMTFLMPDSITHRRLSGAHTASRVIAKNEDLMNARPALYADKLFEIGRIYQRAGHWRAGLRYMRESLRRRPANRRAWAGLALSAARSPFRKDPPS